MQQGNRIIFLYWIFSINILCIYLIYSRWNSYYDALVKVDSFATKKRKKFSVTFDHFRLNKLNLLKEDFLKEYIKIMKPITGALDVFQNISIGCVFPVLILLKEEISEMEEDKNIIHCMPLVSCLSDGLKGKFQSFFDNSNLRLVSNTYLKFSWMTEGWDRLAETVYCIFICLIFLVKKSD